MAGWPEDSDDGTAEARQALLRLAFAFMALVVGIGVAVAVVRADQAGDEMPVAAEAIGPARGADLAAYARPREAALTAADGPTAAVVSLAAYAGEDEARRRVRPMRVRALLVAPPGGEPAVVAGDLAAWAERRRRAAAAERAEIERLLPTVGDPAFVREYVAELERLVRTETALDGSVPLVFAVLVEADADALRALARRPAIRLVDVAEGDRVSVPDARGLRPEEQHQAGDPPTRERS